MQVQLDLSKAWRPYERQADFIFGDNLFHLFLGGVGSGKSHALACAAIVRALRNPGSVGALLGRTEIDLRTVLLPNLFDRLQEMQDQSKVNWIKDYDKGNACLRLLNDSVIWFRPYNRISKLRGLTLTWAAADEVEWSEADPEEIWTVITGRLRGQGPCPGFLVATSPNGLRGITKKFVEAQRKYLEAQARGTVVAPWDQYRITAATSYDNPYLPQHFFDSLQAMSKRRYMQEVEGRVLKPLHTVLAVETRHFVEWSWREHLTLPRVYGVDWGHQDHHVAIMCQVTPQGQWIVADELICDGMPRGHFQDRLQKWMQSHGTVAPRAIGCDRAAPVENQDLQLRWRNTPVRWLESREEQQVSRGLECMRDMLDPLEGAPLLVFSRSLRGTVEGATAGIVPALRGYCYTLDANGEPTAKPRKDNTNDHAVDALRYAIMATADFPDLHGGKRLQQRTDPSRPPSAAAAGWSSRAVH